MLPKNFYDTVETPGALKHVLYGDSVSKDMKTVVKFKNKYLEYITFDELWARLSHKNLIITENDKEYILIDNKEFETISYLIDSDSWKLNVPKYIMRHKVNTNLVRLYFTNLSYLDVTKEHSMLDYDPVSKTLEIKKPKQMKCVPTIMTMFPIKKHNIKSKYLLLGLWFKNGKLDKFTPKNKLQRPFIHVYNRIAMTTYLENNLPTAKISKKSENEIYIRYEWLENLLKKNELDGLDESNKNIPQNIFEDLCKNHFNMISFFIGYWIGDTTISVARNIRVHSINRTILGQIQSLLIIFGIYSQLNLKNDEIYKLSSCLTFPLFKLLQQFKHLKHKFEFRYKSAYYGCDSTKNQNIKKDPNKYKTITFADLVCIRPTKIITKSRIPYNDYVYDLSIPYTHNFMANGCLVHNTDSLFITIPAKESEKLSSKQKLEIVDKTTNIINNAIIKYLNEYFLPKSNISIDQNSTYFKSEMLMSAIMFLDVKKNYAYKLEAKKGKILNNPEIEYTGIQIVRSNAAKLTQNMLREIIEDVILNENIASKDRLSKISEIVGKFHNKFLENVNNLKLEELSIPGKWSKAEQFINGMTLYNFIMKKEIFSVSSSGNFIYCIFRKPALFQGFDMNKIKGIVIPQIYDETLLKNKLDEYQIQIDSVTQWNTLFSTTVERIIDLVKTIKE